MIVGVDQMAFFASYLRHMLSLLDIRAEIVASTGGESLKRLGRIDEDTLLIALSAGRAHPLLLRAIKLAMHRRAKTLAISDATRPRSASTPTSSSTTHPTAPPSRAPTPR